MKLFVYGTLKSGHYNHRAISMDKQNRLIFDDAFIQGQMFDLGAYPAVDIYGDKVVKGELWDISPETLNRLDHIEGHPHHYLRISVPLLGNPYSMSKYEKVLTYHMPKSRLPKNAVPMPVGNWPLKR
jgi:gamma-glutamylcyclotransferase (GGCT)/AIG2-like uncharacterized protein YtfP